MEVDNYSRELCADNGSVWMWTLQLCGEKTERGRNSSLPLESVPSVDVRSRSISLLFRTSMYFKVLLGTSKYFQILLGTLRNSEKVPSIDVRSRSISTSRPNIRTVSFLQLLFNCCTSIKEVLRCWKATSSISPALPPLLPNPFSLQTQFIFHYPRESTNTGDFNFFWIFRRKDSSKLAPAGASSLQRKVGFVRVAASLFSWMHSLLSSRMRPSWLIRQDKRGLRFNFRQRRGWEQGG